MSLLARLAPSSRKELTLALSTSALSGLGGALLIVLINEALAAGPEAQTRLGLAFAVLSIATLVLRSWSQALFVNLRQGTQARLRKEVCRRIAEAPYRELEVEGPARLLSMLVEDINGVADVFFTLPRVAMQSAVVLGCLLYLSSLSFAAVLFALAMMVLGSAVHFWAVRRGNVEMRQARLHEDELYQHFRTLLLGAKELRLHASRRDAFLSEVLSENLEAVRRRRTRGLSIYVFASGWGTSLFFAAIGGVVFGLGALTDVELAVRSGYALAFLYMMHPMEGILEGVPEIQYARLALDRIDALMSARKSSAQVTSQALQARAPACVRLDEVRHSYRRDNEDGTFVLGPLSLTLSPGELVFLIGGNGSGKTTLAKLLAGLYEPESGHLSLDGRAVSASSLQEYRERFSAVFSDFHLFESLLGLEAPELDVRAHELLDALGLAHKVTIRQGVFSTRALSRGQQKRLALLVAWLEDRPFYIFDEWAADQDPTYKELFYRRLLPELKARGKAVLVITHDDRYFGLADRCLKLDAGQLAPSLPGAA